MPTASYHLFLFLLFFTTSLWAQESEPAMRELKLVFAGDIMGHDGQIASARVEGEELFDYTPCFRYVRPILAEADLAVANLELTLPGKPPYTGYPRFRSPNDLALALREAGFDLLVTANNHSNDAGKDGLVATLNTLDQYRLLHTGTFRDAVEKELYYPLIVYQNDFKLAFLNYTYGTNGLPTRAPTLVNLIEIQEMKQDVLVAHTFEPDLIIVIMHWGAEYQLNENAEQRSLADSLFAWGADLVIGAHPHVVQPIQRKSATGPDGQEREVLAAFSLGNFISGQTKKNTDGGILLEVTMEKDLRSGRIRLKEQHFIPIWRYIHKPEEGMPVYYVLPIPEFENDPPPDLELPGPAFQAMGSFAERLRTHLEAGDAPEKPDLLAD